MALTTFYNKIKVADQSHYRGQENRPLVPSAVTSYGPGLGSKATTNLGKQTIKRTFNSFKHDGVRAGMKEIGKAAKWYWKSAKKSIGQVSWEQTKGFLNDLADTVIQSKVR